MKRLVSLAILVSLMTGPAFALTLLSPGDAIIAIDADGLVSNSDYPGGENPSLLVDGDAGSKYLNFGGNGSGFIVTPASSGIVESFIMTTANDAPDRDPSSWELYGTNDAITSSDNSAGINENWTLIDSGSVTLPGDRGALGPVVPVSNTTAYSSYRMVYPTLGGSGLFQLAEIELRDGAGTNLLGVADSVLGIQAGQDSRYPGAEAPMNLIDGDTTTKYLNFGAVNSGFIVTPGVGPSTIDGFQVVTANDSPERDPMVWMMYGTNEAILSEDNSEGDAENWILIAAGTMMLTDDRGALSEMYVIANQLEPYTSYKFLIPALKDAGAANSMQLAEFQLYGVPEPATICLLGLGGLTFLRRRRN